MKKSKDTQSKSARFSSRAAAKLSRIPFFRNSFLKTWLTAAALSCCPAPAGLNVRPSPMPDITPENAFKPDRNFTSSTTFPRDNIVKAFKEGRAGSISEFLSLYDENFKYDTLIVNKDNINTRLCHGQYIRHKGIVEIKHFTPDTTDATPQQAQAIVRYCTVLNDERYQIPVKAHECSHKSFHEEGGIRVLDYVKRPNPFYFEPPKIPYRRPQPVTKVFRMSLRDAAVINQWNEIGGDLGYLIAERELYLKTKDPKVFTYKTAYTEAVKNGEINPFDYSADARRNEYAFLINSTIEWWVQKKKSGYAYTSKSDVEVMINSAKKNNIMMASESVKSVAYKKFSACLTLPIDGRLVNFFDLVEEKNKHLTPQPMVETIVAKAEKEMQMYDYHNESPFARKLRQKRLEQITEFSERFGFRGTTLADKPIPARGLSTPNGNNSNALWIMNKSFSR